MKPLQYWLTAVGSDLILAAMFYSFAVYHSAASLDVAVFWIWVITAVRTLVAFNSDSSTFEKKPRPAGFVWYHAASEIALISALVWFGFAWLPAMYLISSLLMEGARNRKPKMGREAFEAWVRSVPFFAQWSGQGDLERDNEDGGYIDANVHAAWLAWNKRGEA